jgi:hypothetical protein
LRQSLTIILYYCSPNVHLINASTSAQKSDILPGRRASLQDETVNVGEAGEKDGRGEDSLLEQVTAAAEQRRLSENTLKAYRRTWLKLIHWAARNLATAKGRGVL